MSEQPFVIAPGATWYMISRPNPILDPQGNPVLEVCGMAQTLSQALDLAAPIPGSVVVLNVCEHINPPAPVLKKTN